MMKPDYKKMTRSELKKHILSDRNNEEAWNVFFEKLSHLDPNLGYPGDLHPEEMEKIFRAKLNQPNLEQS